MAKAQVASKDASKSKPKQPTKAQMAKADKIFGPTAPLEQPTNPPEPVTVEQRKAERRNNVDSMAFAVQQLSTPVAQPTSAPTPQLTTPPSATEEFNKRLKELRAEFNIPDSTAQVKQIVHRADRVQQNSITRPAENTLCGKIWAAADEITHRQHGAVATIAALKEHPATHNVNEHTIKTQYARWRKYNGVAGRLPKITSVHQAQGEYEGIPVMQPTQQPTNPTEEP